MMEFHNLIGPRPRIVEKGAYRDVHLLVCLSVNLLLGAGLIVFTRDTLVTVNNIVTGTGKTLSQ